MKTTLSRRDFLRSAALASAALPFASRISSAQNWRAHPAGESIRLGLCSYTFRNFSRAQLIGFMKQLNVFDLNAKDVKDHLPMDPQAEQAALADYSAAGIKLHAAGTIYFAKDDDTGARAKFEYCKRAGIGVMVAGLSAPDSLPTIEKLAKEFEIRVAIHNHGPEDKLWPSPLDVLNDIKHRDSRIGCCIDVGHTARAGTDVVGAIHQVGPRLFNLHMKDLKNFHDKESQVPVGDGIMPVKRIFEALIANRYQGFVDLEYEMHPDDPLPGAAVSFAYMRGVLAGMKHKP